MRFLKHNDCEENITYQAALRFSTVILAAVLLGMNYGQNLTPDIAGLCNLFGLTGLAFYFSLELVANQRAQRQATLLQRSAERKLSRRVWADAKTALCHEEAKVTLRHSEKENNAQPRPTEIETAMDSSADLDAYLGPTSQPVLSA